MPPHIAWKLRVILRSTDLFLMTVQALPVRLACGIGDLFPVPHMEGQRAMTPLAVQCLMFVRCCGMIFLFMTFDAGFIATMNER